MGFLRAVRGVLVFGLCGACLAHGQPAKKPKHGQALTPWDRAESARAEFEREPGGTHTRASYMRLLEEYRAIYHDDPGDVHAPAAVNAVAELLAEQGRELTDAASLRNAVGQYEFLREQYPASSLGAPALLAEGRIEEQDLQEPASAREKYAALVKEAPRSRAGGEAKLALAGMRRGGRYGNAARGVDAAPLPGLALNEANARAVEGGKGKADSSASLRNDKQASLRNDKQAALRSDKQAALPNDKQASPVNDKQVPVRSDKQASPLNDKQVPERSGKQASMRNDQLVPGRNNKQDSLRKNPQDLARNDGNGGLTVRPGEVAGATPEVLGTPVEARQLSASNAARSGRLAQVTGIRHWSTASYTRVAIDLGDEVTFEAGRVPNPDRIYFDLHGAKLGSELVGKSFTVTDDGFLKKIRAAQASGDVTRVVLDVSEVTEYSAFLLPNPYRLIIDIHGAKPEMLVGAKTPIEAPPQVAVSDPARASAAANNSGLPAMAPTDGGVGSRQTAGGAAEGRTMGGSSHAADARRGGSAEAAAGTPARPVPNTVAVKAPAAATEVAAVSDAPGRVVATSAPTSKPISATVPVNLGTLARKKKGVKSSDAAVVGDPAAPAKAADRTADGETSMIRALGLKIGRIVIDAGHGGHDSGTLGVDGIEEKDVVLDVALRLGKLLHERLGAEIIYTRSDDTFIPLETRTAIANKAQADLFLSVHANSSADESARGVETYYLNFTSDASALDVAARENAVSGQSIHQLSDLVKKITLKDKIAESREFAADVEGSLYAGLTRGNDGLKDRGVKKAPFVVLIGANMPSILAEISFVTNPRDAAQLREPEYRERVAESLYAGVAKYENGLAGARSTAAPVVRASRGQ